LWFDPLSLFYLDVTNQKKQSPNQRHHPTDPLPPETNTPNQHTYRNQYYPRILVMMVPVLVLVLVLVPGAGTGAKPPDDDPDDNDDELLLPLHIIPSDRLLESEFKSHIVS